MFHPSLLLLFLDGHFETTPDFDVHDFLVELSRPKSAGQAHSARGRAVWLPGQVRPQHCVDRPDILWSIDKLARAITEWTRACDKRLARYSS